MNSINKTARMAGFLYFIYIVFHISANVIGRSKLIVFGDAAATAQNIMASEWQFRIGFMSDLLAAVLFLLIGSSFSAPFYFCSSAPLIKSHKVSPNSAMNPSGQLT